MSVEVRCAGCGERLPLPSVQAALQAEELLESLQESPPFCVVCSCRTVASPRPGFEVWELIDAKRSESPKREEREEVTEAVDVWDLHDCLGY